MAAQHVRLDGGARDFKFGGYEIYKPGCIEQTRHSEDPLSFESGGLVGEVGHGIERVGDYDDY